MSYTLMPYLVDLEELRRAVGSKDEALLAVMKQSMPEVFEEEEVVDHEEDEELSLGQAVRHLVMGEPPDTESAHQYGYALEQLCRHLGEEPEERDCWCDIRWTVLETTGMEEVLKTGSPVPLPPINDFPTIGHLKAEQIEAIVAKMGDGHLKTAAPSGRKPRRSFQSWLLEKAMNRLTRRGPMTDEDVRELLDEYESWLRAAAAKKKSLVFFYY